MQVAHSQFQRVLNTPTAQSDSIFSSLHSFQIKITAHRTLSKSDKTDQPTSQIIWLLTHLHIPQFHSVLNIREARGDSIFSSPPFLHNQHQSLSSKIYQTTRRPNSKLQAQSITPIQLLRTAKFPVFFHCILENNTQYWSILENRSGLRFVGLSCFNIYEFFSTNFQLKRSKTILQTPILTSAQF